MTNRYDLITMNNTPHGYNEDGEYTGGLPRIHLINKNTTMTKKLNRLEEITNELVSLKSKIKEVSDLKSELTFKKSELQNELFQIFRKDRRDRFETESGKVTLAKRKDIAIINERELTEWIVAEGREETFIEKKLNTPLVKSYAKEILKEGGEILAGTEPVETEYIKVSENKG